MSASIHLIRDSAQRVRFVAPNLKPGDRVNEVTLDRLRSLAMDCGLAASLVDKASTADLISIYLVAVKDARGGERTAQRIAMRIDDSLLGFPEPLTPNSPNQYTPTYGEPLPPEPPALDVKALRILIKQEIAEGALQPLQSVLEAFNTGIRADFADLLTESRVEALDALRAEMVIEAQAAAAIALADLRPTLLDVTRPNVAEPVSLGIVHKRTPLILNALQAGVNVYLHGPAGSGKTTVARKCAEAFGLEFRFAAKVESEYQLMGFKDAKGETVRTQFREAYEHGGVFLFDEMDASSPSAVVALNAALANGVCPFPDAIVTRHAEFYCIGAGNTKLTGANRQYAGRNQLDAASIDRFAFIEFGYDDELETALATDHAWCKYVQSVRQAVADRGLNHLVTPRATYDGCKLLAAGLDRETVKNMVVFKGLDADTVRQIEQAL